MQRGKRSPLIIEETPSLLEEKDVLEATAGGWKDLIDAEELKKNIYADRLIST